MFFDALVLGTEAKSLLLSSIEDKLIGKVIQNIVGVGIQLFNIKVLNTLMLLEIFSSVFFVAHLAHYHHFGAFSSDVFVQLGSSHMLKFITIAYIATEFGAVELGVNLKFTQGFPHDFTFAIGTRTSMWELTEIDTILENLINWFKEVATLLTVGTAQIKVWSNTSLYAFSRSPNR